VLASASDTVRLSLHVIAATIWVGGQLVLAALVPALRAAGSEVPRVAARAYNRVAWPAFGVLVVTGIWNIQAESGWHGSRQVVLAVKLALVVVSGVSAWAHTRATTKRGLAIGGALAGSSSLAVVVLGILLAG
jgi:putative copper export protein